MRQLQSGAYAAALAAAGMYFTKHEHSVHVGAFSTAAWDCAPYMAICIRRAFHRIQALDVWRSAGPVAFLHESMRRKWNLHNIARGYILGSCACRCECSLITIDDKFCGLEFFEGEEAPQGHAQLQRAHMRMRQHKRDDMSRHVRTAHSAHAAPDLRCQRS